MNDAKPQFNKPILSKEYRAYYSDTGSGIKDFVIEAENHREAARQFFAHSPRTERCGITVETADSRNYSIEHFDATEFMDERMRQSLSPMRERVAAAAPPRSYLTIRTLDGIYRVIAWLFLIAGILFCITFTATTGSAAAFFGSALFVALGFLIQLVAAELLAILPDIADSTSESRDLLRELRDHAKREV